MSSRYLSNLTLAVLGGFLVVASMAWTVPVFTWLMFGIGIAALALAGPTVLLPRGVAQRAVDGVAAILGAWTIVASMVFGGLAITWLGFASGVGFVALALVGLTLHELSTERVVHSFKLHRSAAPERELAGANYAH
jgi:hypothetical protein